MTHEIWHRIFIISGISSAVFFTLTLFFIIRFRFFSLVRFTVKNSSSETRRSTPYANTRTEKLTASLPPASGGTVIAPPADSAQTGTVAVSGTFRYITDVVITSADISALKSLADEAVKKMHP